MIHIWAQLNHCGFAALSFLSKICKYMQVLPTWCDLVQMHHIKDTNCALIYNFTHVILLLPFACMLKLPKIYVIVYMFMHKQYMQGFLGCLGKLIKPSSNNQSLTPFLSLMLIAAPSLTSPFIVYPFPSFAAVCIGVCLEREKTVVSVIISDTS